LLMTSLAQLRDRRRVITIFIESMNDIFPEFGFVWEELDAPETSRQIEVCTRNQRYGFIRYAGNPQAVANEMALIHNSGQMLAVILEKLKQEQALIEQNKQFEILAGERALLAEKLEHRVAERTVELETANKALTASRIAALNMMEDAVLARTRAEENTAALLHEVAERKRAEAEKVTLEAQFQQAQKMESVGRLAGGVAHDFNNKLGIILGYTELALEEVDPSQPLHANLQEIRKAANHSADLTRQLLAFARKQTIAPKILDLNETVESMLKMLQRLIGEDIDLAWLPGRHLWPVMMDPSQIDQILANLCVNARDAIADVGKVTIETETVTFDEAYCAVHAGFVPGDHIRLAVSDNGCGMDKDTQVHIFEPFFTTKGVGHGTGLGLATVYGIVRQNSGFINVYSEPGQGTTFAIYLPRHVGKTAQIRKKASAKLAARGNETILLVEDEPTILKMTAMMLEMLGYTVLSANTPGEAIRLAGEFTGEIHLLLTDVVMPEMNGRDLSINLLSRYPRLKRLFMSGYTANVIAHHGVLDEGVSFIQKPFSTNDLADKVREGIGYPE
jgi:signal transduction histidine kinase